MKLENVSNSIINLFQVPLYRKDFFISENEKTEILDIFYKIEKTEPLPIGKYPEGSYTSFNTRNQIFDIVELTKIKNHILISAEELHTYIGLEGALEISNSWFSINRKGSYHEHHHHSPNIWSGVYYLEADHDDAAICFINKNISDTHWPFKASKKNLNDYTASEKICRVSSGMMILFPSYLCHKVSQQEKNKDRVCIAFNLDLK